MTKIRFAGLFLCFTVNAAFAEDRVVTGVTDRQADELEQIVRSHLIDPYSAKVPVMHVTIGAVEDRHLCGAVNSKNIYGAYSGLRPFYMPFETLTPQFPDTEAEHLAIMAICDGWGLSVSDQVFTFSYE
ncbi:hypothetical protein [uncultured Tateyamaria sp.]|uniref:hypothetical protein n=1 Tax=uncultured Tateyamaria sp. TaxID=455651 RepID=UPI002610C9CD|nr:hypothetical protein [uncultured Tateyamaria sp.]